MKYCYITVLNAPKVYFINIQENGLQIKVDGINRTFRGTIGPFSCGNLGAHMIGGYIQSFSSVRICHICMATKDDIQIKVSTTSFIYTFSPKLKE